MRYASPDYTTSGAPIAHDDSDVPNPLEPLPPISHYLTSPLFYVCLTARAGEGGGRALYQNGSQRAVCDGFLVPYDYLT